MDKDAYGIQTAYHLWCGEQVLIVITAEDMEQSVPLTRHYKKWVIFTAYNL